MKTIACVLLFCVSALADEAANNAAKNPLPLRDVPISSRDVAMQKLASPHVKRLCEKRIKMGVIAGCEFDETTGHSRIVPEK
jgi:hypothetical protein